MQEHSLYQVTRGLFIRSWINPCHGIKSPRVSYLVTFQEAFEGRSRQRPGPQELTVLHAEQ